MPECSVSSHTCLNCKRRKVSSRKCSCACVRSCVCVCVCRGKEEAYSERVPNADQVFVARPHEPADEDESQHARVEVPHDRKHVLCCLWFLIPQPTTN
jgi:hypothetical protein